MRTLLLRNEWIYNLGWDEKHFLFNRIVGALALFRVENMIPIRVENMNPIRVENMIPFRVENMIPIRVENMIPIRVENMIPIFSLLLIHKDPCAVTLKIVFTEGLLYFNQKNVIPCQTSNKIVKF